MNNVYRIAFLLWVFAIERVLAQPAAPINPAPMDFQQKLKLYLKSTYQLRSIVVPGAVAGIDQIKSSPAEWGHGGDAHGERFATRRGELEFQNFLKFGVAAATHEDPRFVRCGQLGVWQRMKYVFVHTYVARTDKGGEQLALSSFADVFGGAFLPNGWLPGSQGNAKSAVDRARIFLATDLAMNMGQEFGPDSHRFFREKIVRKIFHQ